MWDIGVHFKMWVGLKKVAAMYSSMVLKRLLVKHLRYN